MRVPVFKIDDPAQVAINAMISYQDVTTGAGNAFGTTLVCARCSTAGLQPSYVGLSVKILSGGASGQVRPIMVHALATGTLTVANAFTDETGAVEQITATTLFCILSTGGGGAVPAPVVSPSIGLWMFGECDPAMVASTTAIQLTNLAGFPDDIFNNEFWMQVIHNNDVPGAAPEREIRLITNYVGATGMFTTDAFSANVEADDLVAVFHESIMSVEILGFGTLDTSSTTVPADSTRAAAYAWENNDYFKGCRLMPTEGDCRFQPRPIAGYVSATGVFALAEPFSQAPGAVDYIIVADTYPVDAEINVNTLLDLALAELVTTGTRGTVTTDGTEQTAFEISYPANVIEPISVQIDFTNQTVAETVVIRTYYRIKSVVPAGGGLVQDDEMTFVGVISPELITIDLSPNRNGLRVTIERTAGGAFDYDWEAFYRG